MSVQFPTLGPPLPSGKGMRIQSILEIIAMSSGHIATSWLQELGGYMPGPHLGESRTSTVTARASHVDDSATYHSVGAHDYSHHRSSICSSSLI